MEIGLEPSIPTYSGGLGVLAGDTIRSAADLEIPMIAVTLLHRSGYFYQRIDADGTQREEPVSWPIDDFLQKLEARIAIEVRGRRLTLACWRYCVRGVSGFDLPVYLLDTDLPENDPADRRLTDVLYGGNEEYRLCQEAVLGLGGLAVLRALGHREIARPLRVRTPLAGAVPAGRLTEQALSDLDSPLEPLSRRGLAALARQRVQAPALAPGQNQRHRVAHRHSFRRRGEPICTSDAAPWRCALLPHWETRNSAGGGVRRLQCHGS
jgi:hypothetical protein